MIKYKFIYIIKKQKIIFEIYNFNNLNKNIKNSYINIFNIKTYKKNIIIYYIFNLKNL